MVGGVGEAGEVGGAREGDRGWIDVGAWKTRGGWRWMVRFEVEVVREGDVVSGGGERTSAADYFGLARAL